MSYFTRVFCKSENIPTVSELLKLVNSLGYSVSTNLSQKELESTGWAEFELRYKEGKLSILVEINKVAIEGGLAKEEIGEFKDAIGKPGFFDKSKKRVLKHLDQTQYIICNQLPMSDIDDEGHEINEQFMKIFVDHYEGMMQFDDEGFYEDSKLILKT